MLNARANGKLWRCIMLHEIVLDEKGNTSADIFVSQIRDDLISLTVRDGDSSLYLTKGEAKRLRKILKRFVKDEA